MKEPKNHGKQWTPKEIKELRNLANSNTPTGLIAYKLGRTPDAIADKACENDISLKPSNKSPYDRKVSKKKNAKK